MGPVVMGGAGGVLLELMRDVAFAAPPINLAKAHDLIARTKAGQLMKGYRGSGALDADAYAKALVALGRMAQDLGDVLESVDVNPFLLLEEGGVALDALVVLRPPRRD
jgi:acetyltransferase